MTFMAEFRDAFFEESADHVATLEQGLLALDGGSVDVEQMHAIFRSAHSLKGLASTLGFPEIATFTHDMEGVLDRLRGGTIGVTPELAALLLRANDTLRGLLAASHLGEAAVLDTREVTAALRAVLASPVAHARTTQADQVAVGARVVEDECKDAIRDTTTDPAHAGVAAHAPAIDVASRNKPPAEVTVASIRVPTEKVDALMDLVGQLISSQSKVNQIASAFDMSQLTELQDALATLDHNIRDLQERIASVRMLPVATVFNRFPRMVRDAATKLGKKVRLEMYGIETELDKGIVERVGDPLTHLVRNAIDHGLETPNDRLAAGKCDMGTITLRAFRERSSVVIEVADDGRGLDTRRIREKAEAGGLIRPDDELDDAAIHQLIFVPGLSTAAQVSDLSGRGVGMDVVKRNVEGLGGSVMVTSVPGHGSRIRIRLPLTLAMFDGVIGGLGGDPGGHPRDGDISGALLRTDSRWRVRASTQESHDAGDFEPL